MSDQVIVAGAALIAFGSFFVGYGLGWGQCTAWRDQLDDMPFDHEVNHGDRGLLSTHSVQQIAH
jgi:hypothetical protein